MRNALPADTLDCLFREARTHNGWSPEPIDHQTLRSLYDLVKFGPTSANCSPARFLFVTSQEGRERLSKLVTAANQPKVLEAPCTAIIGYDLDFAKQMPRLFPHNLEAGSWFDNVRVAEATAFRNSTLQGGYLIMAARALGLDCGPMSGFDPNGVDAAFFRGTNVKSNFICLLGQGTTKNLFPRSPRLDFEEACTFA